MPNRERKMKWPGAGWLSSTDIEVLEKEGATSRGVAIIDELNAIYARTGAIEPIRKSVVTAARKIFSRGRTEVKILEVGVRDGALLRSIGNDLNKLGVATCLHGVEFHQNLVDLAAERCKDLGPPTSFALCEGADLRGFADRSFDIVFSAFMLHHRSGPELCRVLADCNRISRDRVFHLDLERSFVGVAGIWLVYTLLGARRSRHDAVLSCRRSYRRTEIRQILEKANLGHRAKVDCVPPFRWCIEYSISGVPS